MNKDVKTKWIAALRGGEYKQAQGQLCVEGSGHCCLGVLEDLFHHETGRGGMPPTSWHMPEISDNCKEWAGLERSDPIVWSDPERQSLADLNDCGVSFKDIADMIEEDL